MIYKITFVLKNFDLLLDVSWKKLNFITDTI